MSAIEFDSAMMHRGILLNGLRALLSASQAGINIAQSGPYSAGYLDGYAAALVAVGELIGQGVELERLSQQGQKVLLALESECAKSAQGPLSK